VRNNELSTAWIIIAIVSAATLAVPPRAMAQQEKVVYSFTNYFGGQQPQGGLVFDKAGNIYGVTTEAGQFGYGTVFKLTIQPNGRAVESVLHSFNRDDRDGFRPNGGLVLDAFGNLYGTTFNGGSQRCLHFSGFHGCGTVYELIPQPDGTWKEQILHDFAASDGDGANPYARLVFDAAGNLYGTTYHGGSSKECENAGCGTVFELTHGEDGTWQEKTLFNFYPRAGTNPIAGLTLDAAGNLYGTTPYASRGSNGTVFELTPSTSGEWNETILHSFAFDTPDGATPESGVTFDSSGNLYGTTFDGGDEGYGTVYELTPSGGGAWTETIIHSFQGNLTDAAQPGQGALVFDAAGNLYGATTTGGTSFQGALFEFTPSAGGVWTESILHNFAAGRGGNFPSSFVTLDSAGNIYGTTLYDNASVYEIVPPK
jgi:uncharacterized repeat protein (TIGR03803 family)